MSSVLSGEKPILHRSIVNSFDNFHRVAAEVFAEKGYLTIIDDTNTRVATTGGPG